MLIRNFNSALQKIEFLNISIRDSWKSISFCFYFMIISYGLPLEFLFTYSISLKTTCHIKAKFFVWTKHLEKLLSAKFLISSRTVYQYSWIFWKQYFIELEKVARIYSHVSYITKSCTCHWWLYLEIAFNWIIWSCTTMSF